MAKPISFIDPRLAEFATAAQVRLIEAVNKAGSLTQGGMLLGMGQSAATRSYQALLAKASKQGYSPAHGWTHPIPEPHVVSGVSTLYNGDGEIAAQWVKTKLSEEQTLELVTEFVRSIAEEITGKSRVTKAPKRTSSDLLTVYPFGDIHIGMYAWHLEAGEDFDTEIALADLRGAVTSLVDRSPASDTAILLPLGDTLHADTFEGTTARGTRMDMDTRYPRVIALAAKILIWAAEATLKKHKKLIIRVVAGNHDPIGSVALRLILEAHFRNNKRVTVDTSPDPYWAYPFGKCLVATTHGDDIKITDLPRIMASKWPELFASTKFRTWLVGHVHHRTFMEHGFCTTETFRTLAPKDAWTNKKGFTAGRDMNAITYHKEFGEVERHRADIALIRSLVR